MLHCGGWAGLCVQALDRTGLHGETWSWASAPGIPKWEQMRGVLGGDPDT